MRYTLMHKNIEIADMNIDELGNISKVRLSNNNSRHLPLGAEMNMMKFHQWWKDRAVPATRKGVKDTLRKLGIQSTQSILVNTLALSLTDCYWIKPSNIALDWEKVNLFENEFIDILGDNIKNNIQSEMKSKTIFKCASSQGELQKKWCIDNSEKRVLIKGNWGESYQQSLNEVFASEIHKMQSIFPYVQYGLTDVTVEDDKQGIGCYSYNYCNNKVEFVSAWELLQTVKLKNNESWYNKFKSICINRLGFTEEYVDSFLGYQILVDYLITNTDRHMNNFGVIRDPDTLRYIGFAPIYDSGNSMFFRSQNLNIVRFSEIQTHSFVKREQDLVRLVKCKNLINLNKLPSKEFFYKLYNKDVYEGDKRIEQLWNLYNKKIDRIHAMQIGR